MAKARASIKMTNIPVLFMKEGKMFVVYSPALDLSTCAPTFDEAKKNFHEAIDLFFLECIKRKTLDRALESLGWQRSGSESWQPPLVVGHDTLPVSVPTSA